MDHLVNRGRNYVITVAAVAVGYSLYNFITYLLFFDDVGWGLLISQATWFFVYLALSIILYSGYSWAKWVMGVMMLLSCITGLTRLFEVFYVGIPFSPWLSFIGIASIIYGALGLVLIASPSIRAYQSAQRRMKVQS